MEELEKEYMNLRHQEQDLLKNLKGHKDEDLLKRQAVKNQKLYLRRTRPLFKQHIVNLDDLRCQSSKNIDGDEGWSRISELLLRIATFKNKSINKWQRKTQVTTGAAAIKSKLHVFNQNIISEQVASYTRDTSRMVRQMQMRKSAVAVFGS